MKKNLLVVICILCFSWAKSFSSDFLGNKKFSSSSQGITTTVYFNYSEISSNLQLDESSQIKIGNISYLSSTTKEYKADLIYKSLKIGFGKDITNKVYYGTNIGVVYNKSFKIGEVGQDFSSVGDDNNFGLCVSGTLSYSLFPETFLTPESVLNLEIEGCGVNFNTLSNGFYTNTKLTIFSYIVSICFSKSVGFLEPYFGTKVIFRETELVDIVSNYRIEGTNCVWAINIGSMLKINNISKLGLEVVWSTPANLSFSIGIKMKN